MFPSLPSSSPCALADGCAQLAQDLGLPTSLAALGIQVTLEDIRFRFKTFHDHQLTHILQDEHTDLLAGEAMKVTRLLQNNMRDITRTDAHNLYSRAMQGNM